MRRAANPRRTLRMFALSLVGAAALLAGPLAAKSHAGVYTATDCAASNQNSEAQPGEYGHHFFGLTRDCSPVGGGLTVSLPQAYWAWGFGRWTVYAPAGTHIVNVTGTQQGVNADGWYVELHVCTPSDCGPNIYVSGDGYWRTFGSSSGYYTNWWVQLGCGAGSCYGSTAAGAHVKDVNMTMSDDSEPNLSVGGELIGGGVQRGSGRVEVTAADAGSGLTSAWLLINGQEVARRSYACVGPSLHPCPLQGVPAHFNLDTERSPFYDGRNSLEACVADYGAPPNVTCTSPRSIAVDNSCKDSNVPGGSNLSAVFPRSEKDVVGVKAGHGALLTGRLTDNSGDPVADATLCTKEAIAGRGLQSVGTVTTNSAGRYRYGVAPGPNRHVRVGYRFNRHQIEREARFFSRVMPRLKLSPKRRTRNGEDLRLYGSIPGPANGGRIVILQARYPHSKKWNTFAKAKTDGHGMYAARYRFSATFVTTKYGMRAVVPEQNGYPYKGGASRVRSIKVIGRAPGR